ncbi:MAG TPA: ABC transporter substrate-binding protein [Stellaceae bacterium]|nr:ABC transporter substrate-binding protein [Stellaceae bacterium]
MRGRCFDRRRFWIFTLLAMGLSSAPAIAEVVTLGAPAVITNAPFFIAEANGYFKNEGLSVNIIGFDSAAKMIPSLGTGELDVGAGAPSVGLYNAVARGVDIKIVADKGHAAPGYDWQALMVRKALIDSGKFKSFKDLKGLRVATAAKGATETSILNVALERGGLTLKDVDQLYLPFTEQAAAFANGAIDASLTTEPTITYIVRAGTAVPFVGVDKFYPNHQTAVVLYGGPFIKKHPEAAKKFMVAYLRGVRFYNGALAHGQLAGPNADRVIAILIRYGKIKDPTIYHAVAASACDPDGNLDMASLSKDLRFFEDRGDISGKVMLDQVVDTSFARAAVAELGPYHQTTKQ